MLSDENCFLLAIDFDGDGYEKDVSAFVKVCQKREFQLTLSDRVLVMERMYGYFSMNQFLLS